MYQPQIENPVNIIVTDTQNWVTIQGYYLANGGEQFLTIGNFYENNQLDTAILNYGTQPFAYYYIDDVSVIDCSATAINEISIEDDLKIFPNPVRDKLTIST